MQGMWKEVKDDISFCPYCGEHFDAQQKELEETSKRAHKELVLYFKLRIKFDTKTIIILTVLSIILILFLFSTIKQVYAYPDDKLCHISYCKYVKDYYEKMSLLKAILNGYDIHKCLSIL